jgi:hypothetical protein
MGYFLDVGVEKTPQQGIAERACAAGNPLCLLRQYSHRCYTIFIIMLLGMLRHNIVQA